MTRATVEDSTAGLGQALRAGRLLVGGSSFDGVSELCMAAKWISNPEYELFWSATYLRPHASPWVALGAANREDPTESTAKQTNRR